MGNGYKLCDRCQISYKVESFENGLCSICRKIDHHPELKKIAKDFLEDHSNLSYDGDGVNLLLHAAMAENCPLQCGFKCSDFEWKNKFEENQDNITLCSDCKHYSCFCEIDSFRIEEWDEFCFEVKYT